MNKAFGLLAVSSFAVGLAACDVDQTEEGDAPEVNVEGGDLPEYDVETPDVDVDTGTETVEVPTVDVDVDQQDAEGEPVTEPSE